jgi:hypothetical protein
VQRRQYIQRRTAVIRWVSVSVGRVQEGKKSTEYATLARIAAANVLRRTMAMSYGALVGL